MQNFYTAAVVDYLHVYSDYPKELFKENVEQYVQFMRNASRQYADIIVFPEYGLVDIMTLYSAVDNNSSDLEAYSSYVPDPKHGIAPCEDSKYKTYERHLVKLSCAARLHGIYTIFNLPEKAINRTTGTMEFYNTDVVLDRSGTVIAKFRKINLSQEPFLTPGTEIVTFQTDFNVTFGIFTCFDLLFSTPALEVLRNGAVTDIIFPTAWYSETPFLQGLSIQHGYAKANGVNMLVSGLQEPYFSDGGSAIYLGDGTIAEVFITNRRKSRALVGDVPIIRKRVISTCEKSSRTTLKRPVDKKEFTDIDKFPLNRQAISGYIYEPLGRRGKTRTRVCTAKEDFCCIFNITADNSSLPNADYGHRIIIYKGLSRFETNMYGGIRVCALLACLNETEDSCGFRTNTTHRSIKFKSIEIQTIVDITNDSYNQPSTLKSDLTPIVDYVYCETKIDDSKMKIKMALTSPQDSIVTFGIFGRMYGMDSTEEEEEEEEEQTSSTLPIETGLSLSIVLSIMLVSTIVLLAIGSYLWKKYKS